METLAPVVKEVLTTEHASLLTIGALGTLWATASGVEMLRTALNIAYNVEETRPLLKGGCRAR